MNNNENVYWIATVTEKMTGGRGEDIIRVETFTGDTEEEVLAEVERNERGIWLNWSTIVTERVTY